MKYGGLAIALMSTALAGLSVAAHAAEEMQVVRSVNHDWDRVLPFTTFQKEIALVVQSLPCKWVSVDGRVGPSYGNGRYDFLCKGGDWATVSLFVDKSGLVGNGLGRVRLTYRDWQDNVHPNAGEAFIAQQFLQHVLTRFVPPSVAGQVMEGFWQRSSRKWESDGVRIKYASEDHGDFWLHSLEVIGTARAVATSAQETAAPQPKAAVVTPTDAGLAKEPNVMLPTVPRFEPTQVAPLQEPKELVPVAAPIALPAPVLPAPPVSLPAPGTITVSRPSGEGLAVPPDAPAGEVSNTLPKASPAELNTAPAPESLVKPVPPPEVSATLVPTVDDLINGRAKAPSNFDAYNRAEELTRDVEKKALISGQSRIQKAQQTAGASPTVTLAPAQPAPSLKPVAMPGAEGMNSSGLGQTEAPVVIPDQSIPTRTPAARPLPQLQFVPKAEPVQNTDDVIKFEDEGSKL